MQHPKIFSFFSGAGFLDLGFEMAGYEIVYVNELHSPFLKMYKHSRKALNLSKPQFGYFKGDASELLKREHCIKLKELVKETQKNDLVGFIGGPPCPDFSVGGKNKGKNGDNGKLSMVYAKWYMLN